MEERYGLGRLPQDRKKVGKIHFADQENEGNDDVSMERTANGKLIFARNSIPVIMP
jgi:hypothetical protein